MKRPELPSQPHTAPSRRIGRLAAAACALTAGLGLSACVAPPESPPLRVSPNYRLEHAGSGLAQGYALLAQRYEGEARWHEAMQAWGKAVQAAPSDADLRNALGQAQARLGDHNAAVESLRRAIQLAPDQAGLHNNLGYALMRGWPRAGSPHRLAAGTGFAAGLCPCAGQSAPPGRRRGGEPGTST